MKTVYLYDPETGLFLGEIQAHPSPMEEGKFLEPIHSTDKKPMAASAGKIAKFFPDQGVWMLIPDNRGKVFYDPSGAAIQWDRLDHPGEEFTEKLSTALELSLAIQKRANELSGECALAITGGFSSSALGESNHYPSDQNDQLNMMAAALLPSAILPCRNMAGEWHRVEHDVMEVAKVLEDWVAHKNAQSDRLAALKEKLNSAKLKDVHLIAW